MPVENSTESFVISDLQVL